MTPPPSRDSGSPLQRAVTMKTLSQPLSPPLSNCLVLDKGRDKGCDEGFQLSLVRCSLGFRISP
jgi:hypothetical protein